MMPLPGLTSSVGPRATQHGRQRTSRWQPVNLRGGLGGQAGSCWGQGFPGALAGASGGMDKDPGDAQGTVPGEVNQASQASFGLTR